MRSFSSRQGSMLFDPQIDYYSRLGGLKSTSTADEIKKRFYELAKKHHPDTGA